MVWYEECNGQCVKQGHVIYNLGTKHGRKWQWQYMSTCETQEQNIAKYVCGHVPGMVGQGWWKGGREPREG